MSGNDPKQPDSPSLGEAFKQSGSLLPRELERRMGTIPMAPLKRPDLHVAAMKGDIPALEKAIAGGVDIDEAHPIFGTAMHSAAEAGQDKVIDYLVAKGADIDSRTLMKKHTPLDNALRFGQRDVAFKLARLGGTATLPHANNKLFKRQGTADYTNEHLRLQERLAKHRLAKLMRVKRNRKPR